MIHFHQTNYGFEYGALTVNRIHNDKGCVWLDLSTPKKQLQVYVTKTGKVRVFDMSNDGKELT